MNGCSNPSILSILRRPKEIPIVTAIDLLAYLRRRGLAVRSEAGRVLAGPSRLLSPADRESIGRHKPALLALLAGPEPRPSSVQYLRRSDGRAVGPADADLYTWPGADGWYECWPPPVRLEQAARKRPPPLQTPEALFGPP